MTTSGGGDCIDEAIARKVTTANALSSGHPRYSTGNPAVMKPASTSVTVVFLGTFHPTSLVLPSLIEHKALGKNDAEQAVYEALLRDQVVDLKLPWARLVCIPDRLSIETPQAPYVRIMDLAAKCIREVDGGCVVGKVGLNVSCQYLFSSWEERDALGQRLAPLTAWGAWGETVRPSLRSRDATKHGGLLRATVREPRLDDRLAGYFDVHVEAGGVEGGSFGVNFRTNDHYEPLVGSPSLKGFSPRLFSEMLLEAVESNFDASILKALWAIDSIVNA